ncbi:MAG: GNAT family N-acetyltransferase [Jannaschia sp.]
MLTDGYHPVPPGKIAAIVTHLEMAERPSRPARPLPDGVTLRPVAAPGTDWYRNLFTRIGGVDWLWVSRLRMPDAELGAILADRAVEVRAVEVAGRAEGLLELDFRAARRPELAFFGLTPALQGRGIGSALMAEATRLAFARDIDCLTIHTCTLDSPVALPFYLRCGFVPLRREVEIVDDPRLAGTLPRDAGPHHPIIPG